MKTKSIRYYFITSITTVLIASVLVMGLIQSYIAISYFREEKESLLGKITASIAGGTSTGEFVTDNENIESMRYIAEITGSVVVLTGMDGTVRYAFGEQAPSRDMRVDQDTLEQIGAEGYTEVGQAGGLFSVRSYVSARPLLDAQSRQIGYVFAAADASLQQVYLADTMSTFILSAALALLLSTLLALGLTNRTVMPIRRISEAAQRFAEGDYSTRVPVQGDDELAQLSVTFNNMADSFEATDSSRRSFMGNIAHELRTPMTSIKGFIDGMLDGTIPVEQRDRYLTIVSGEVGRLSRLIKNMLDVAKLETGEYVPELSVFDLWVPVTSVLLGSEQRLSGKKIQVLGLDHEYPAFVHADEDFVHQILYNLVENAIKFTDEGGSITVSITSNKGMVAATIRNTGVGISAEALPHIFERFYKADKSRGINVRGAGLGLHISKVLLGLMGGRIWADSEPGEWAEFSFSLPAATTKKTRKAETARSQQPDTAQESPEA